MPINDEAEGLFWHVTAGSPLSGFSRSSISLTTTTIYVSSPTPAHI
jgi:hypothetical protein